MTLDFLRAAVLTLAGGVVGYGVLALAAPYWRLQGGITAAAIAVLVAGMVGTALPLFGGVRARRLALVVGIGVGVAIALLLP
jgi:hypothetical protein